MGKDIDAPFTSAEIDDTLVCEQTLRHFWATVFIQPLKDIELIKEYINTNRTDRDWLYTDIIQSIACMDLRDCAWILKDVFDVDPDLYICACQEQLTKDMINFIGGEKLL